MGDAWTNATPLRNADFKALLATPRPAGQQQQQQTSRSGGGAGSFKHPKARGSEDSGDDEGGRKFKKPAPKRPGGKPGKEKDKEGSEGPKYRDRAKERREGVNADFDEAEANLAAQGLGAANLQNLSIEQSKFLGGDIAHTHLVKGLDYALLQQERSKLELAGGGSSLAAGAGPSAAAAAAAEAAAAAASAAAAAAKAPVSFVSAQGRALFNAVFRPPPHNRTLVREMFQPRRTAFVFEFDSPVASDVPTTLRRSKADCPSVQDVVAASSDAPLLERISKIMSYINQTASGKGGKRSARDSQYIRSILTGVSTGSDAQVHGQLVMKGQGAITAAAAAAASAAAASAAAAAAAAGGGGGAAAAPGAAAAAADDDEDIFGDAGTDYAPVIPAAKKGAAEGGRRAEGLFAGGDHQEALMAPPTAAAAAGRVVDMDTEEGELPGQQQRQMQLPGPPSEGQQQGLQSFQSQQQYYGQFMQQPAAEEPKWRVRTKPGAKAALQGFADDAYDDCFPGIADYGGDDDDEADPKAAEGEEGEAAAGAAGGSKKGGKKGAAGAGAGGMDDGERKLKQKLNRDVQQMQGIFKEKGWGNEAAFKKPDRLESVAATPARKRLRI